MTPMHNGTMCINTALLSGEAVQALVDRELREEDRKVQFLTHHFASPGLLCGDPLSTSGFSVQTIEPEDMVEFFMMHTLGPKWMREGARVRLTSVDGRTARGRYFFRTKARLVDGHGRCPFVAVRLRPGTGMADPGPESCVAGVTSLLTASGITHVIERAMLVGEWVIWILFDRPVEEKHAIAFTHHLESLFGSHGLHDPETIIYPLLMKEPQPLFLPYQFFGVGRFGLLYRYQGERLVPADPDTVETYNLDGVFRIHYDGVAPCDDHSDEDHDRLEHDEPDGEDDQPAEQVGQKNGGEPSSPEAWTSVIDTWARSFGSRAVRAGELVRVMDLVGVTAPVPGLVPGDPAQRQAILLGRAILQDLCGRTVAGYRVEGSRSGNSTVFRLLPP